jgi:hypothetical protein
MNEVVTKSPTEMIKLPPNHYCIIKNPVIKNEKGEIVILIIPAHNYLKQVKD